MSGNHFFVYRACLTHEALTKSIDAERWANALFGYACISVRTYRWTDMYKVELFCVGKKRNSPMNGKSSSKYCMSSSNHMEGPCIGCIRLSQSYSYVPRRGQLFWLALEHVFFARCAVVTSLRWRPWNKEPTRCISCWDGTWLTRCFSSLKSPCFPVTMWSRCAYCRDGALLTRCFSSSKSPCFSATMWSDCVYCWDGALLTRCFFSSKSPCFSATMARHELGTQDRAAMADWRLSHAGD